MGYFNIKNKTGDSADLYFYGDIVSSEWEKWSHEDVCPADIVSALKETENVKQLNIYINSGGGNVFAGHAIYNQLMRHKAHKTVYIDSLAASIASEIAFAGDEIVMPENTYLMIHKAWTTALGNANDLRDAAQRLEIIEQSIVETYMKNVKDSISEDKIKELMAAETWMDAKTANGIFNKISISEANFASACVSGLNFNMIPHNLKIVKKGEESENIEGCGDDNIRLDIADKFLFLEGEKEYEQKNA